MTQLSLSPQYDALQDVFEQIRHESLSNTEAGTRFEKLMRDAFIANPVYDFTDVWLWMDWPDRVREGFKGDIGVDLVARRPDGTLCAIQCKFYQGTVAAADIAGFLAIAQADPFSESILVNTGSVNDTAHLKLVKAGCRILNTAHLSEWGIDWDACWNRQSTVSWRIPHAPREHQNEALEKIAKGFTDHDRGRLVLPCGTGKSLVAMWVAEEHAGKGGQVLYAVPSISLIGQTMREWAENRTCNHEYIGVCSDPRTGKLRRDEQEELTQVPIPVSTSREDIAARLGTAPPADAMRVVFTTYQSLPVVMDSIRIANEQMAEGGDGFRPFDLFVCDEAHRTTGVESEGKTGDKATGFLLAHNNDALPAVKRLYMTATPRVFTSRLKAKLSQKAQVAGEDFDSFSMDNESVYGPLFYSMTFSEAIDQDLLTDYRVLIVGKRADGPDVSDRYVRLMRREDKNSRKGRLVTEGYATKLLGVLDALSSPHSVMLDTDRVSGEVPADDDADGRSLRSAILFANTVARSKIAGERGRFEREIGKNTNLLEAISRDLDAKYDDRRILKVEADHMDGSTRADDRATQLAWLRHTPDTDPPTCRLLTNSRVLSEGIDVPSLDAVVFMDPRRSAVDVTQAVGRAIRKAPGKKLGYIIIPVEIPAGMHIASEDVLAGERFDAVWEVVRALRSHDDRVDLWLTDHMTPPIMVSADSCDDCRQDDCPRCNPPDMVQQSENYEQLALSLWVKKELERQVFSKMVDVCGDRKLWPTWGKNAAEVCESVRKRLSGMLTDPDAKEVFKEFVASMRETTGDHVKVADIEQMVAQHVVTIPIFDALFPDSGFAKENPMSKAMDRLLSQLTTADTEPADADDADLAGYALAQRLFAAELKPLTRAYNTMRNMLSADITPTQKVDLMREIYDGFFQHAMKDTTEQLGIVYTPVELVDFVIRATDAVCRKHFDKGLTAEGVHILDPFTGTGTFIHQLLTITDADGKPIIRNEDLARKYTKELHANELVLLAYYVAALKIEAGMESRDGFADGKFDQFANIVYGDTFLTSRAFENTQLANLEDNTKAARKQNELPIKVIIGNPPWSAGQKRASDENPNIGYPEIEARVRETYGKRHRDITGRGSGKSGGNLYVEAIRWASDRVGDPKPDEPRTKPEVPGIIAFIHPYSLATGTSLIGMRAALREEFSDIYVFNLRGDAYKQGEAFKKEGDKIFGGGSRNGVQITILISDPSQKKGNEHARLNYAAVPEYATREMKFTWLAELQPGTDDFWSHFEEVPVNPQHDWVELTDGSFEQLPIPVCKTKGSDIASAAVHQHALGLTTNCDTYVYSFSRDDLIDKIKTLIGAYEQVRRAIHEEGKAVDNAITSTSVAEIKWHNTLKQAVKANKAIEFDESCIRPVLYRPFQQLWLYEDNRILSSIKTVSKMFSHDHSAPPSGVLVNQTQQLPFGLVATNCIFDLCATGRQTRAFGRQRLL